MGPSQSAIRRLSWSKASDILAVQRLRKLELYFYYPCFLMFWSLIKHRGNFVFRHIFTEYTSLRSTFIRGYVSLTGIKIIPTIQNVVEISRVISDLNYAYGKTETNSPFITGAPCTQKQRSAPHRSSFVQCIMFVKTTTDYRHEPGSSPCVSACLPQ